MYSTFIGCSALYQKKFLIFFLKIERVLVVANAKEYTVLYSVQCTVSAFYTVYSK